MSGVVLALVQYDLPHNGTSHGTLKIGHYTPPGLSLKYSPYRILHEASLTPTAQRP